MNPHWPGPDNIAEFSYSRLPHFALFRGLPFRSYNTGDPDPAVCDLKVYQDYLVYCFIRRNVPAGSRILDVGGGDSRVLKFLAAEYECWNVDKCEGLGNGPVQFTSPHYRIVYDYLGAFSPELPAGYFDLVFSISALEHTPEDQDLRVNILRDIHRVLKPGCPSFHCFDSVYRPGGASWVNGLVPYLHSQVATLTRRTPPDGVAADPQAYFMSEEAYDTHWRHIVKKTYADFGRPYSLNLLWFAP